MRIFYFHKIADLHIIANNSIRAQMHIRTNHNVILYFAVVSINKLQFRSIPDSDICQPNIRTNLAIFTDLRSPFQPGIWINNSVLTYFNTFFDKGTGRIHDRYTVIHQFIQNPLTHNVFCFCQLAARIDAHDHIAVSSSNTADFFTHCVQFCQNIGQIIFTLRIITS